MDMDCIWQSKSTCAARKALKDVLINRTFQEAITAIVKVSTNYSYIW